MAGKQRHAKERQCHENAPDWNRYWSKSQQHDNRLNETGADLFGFALGDLFRLLVAGIFTKGKNIFIILLVGGRSESLVANRATKKNSE